MGFWDKVKSLVGGPPAGNGGNPSAPVPAPAAKAYSAQAPVAKASPAVAVAAAMPAPAARAASSKDLLDASAILGLSADEVRKRALRIDPYRTAWIGRVDTIPPQSDEHRAHRSGLDPPRAAR